MASWFGAWGQAPAQPSPAGSATILTQADLPLGTRGNLPVSSYSVGEVVEYFSSSTGKWIPAKVLRVNAASGTVDLDCKPDVPPAKIRQPAPQPLGTDYAVGGAAWQYKVGDSVEYFGATQQKWVPAKVVKVNVNGTLDLDCKPGVQPDKVRRPALAPGSGNVGIQYAPGDLVEYFGASLNKWIPAKVLTANSDGTFDLDCKPRVLPDKIRLPTTSGGNDLYKAGEIVEYFSASQSRWIPAKVIAATSRGTYDLDCKPDVTADKIRHPAETHVSGGSPAYSVGETVEYFGATQQQWIPAKVLSVNNNGTFGLDCKPEVPTTRIRKPGTARSSSPDRHVTFRRDISKDSLRLPQTMPGGRLPSTQSAGETSVIDPVQLLRMRGSTFVLCPEGLAALERYGRRRISVVAVCGSQGVGRSFLVNLLVERIQQGKPPVQVGAGSQKCTEGLWLWGVADESDAQSPLLAILDCEAFVGSARGTDSSDREARYMSLCAVLASIVVLNTRGALTDAVLQTLAPACRFSDSIEERGTEAQRPALLWLLRDFEETATRDAQGRQVSTDEYMERALSTSNGVQGPKDMPVREVRQTFQKFFRQRTCIALPPPTAGSQLGRLKDLPYSNLSAGFKSAADQVRAHVFDSCRGNPKGVSGQALGCLAFAHLLRQLVEAANGNRILSIRSSWESVQHTTCGQLADELRAEAAQKLRKLASGQPVLGGAQLPLSDEALHIVLRDQRHSLKSHWEEQAVGSEAVRKEYWQELKETLAKEETMVRVQNTRLADQRLMEGLQSWQRWLDDDGTTTSVEQICNQLGGTMDKVPAMPLSRAGRAALQAAARRVSAARSAVAATMAQHEDLKRKAMAWGQEAAQQEGTTRSELESQTARLRELESQASEREQAAQEVQGQLKTKEGQLRDAKEQLQRLLADVEAVQSRESELKAQHRSLTENQAELRSELDKSRAAFAATDAERLAGERLSRTAAEAIAADKLRLEQELEEARSEVERFQAKIDQERTALMSETDKSRQEHSKKVEEVSKQLEEERKQMKGEQDRARNEQARLVEDTRRQLDEERRSLTGTLGKHQGQLLERERGAGVLEGKVQVLTEETTQMKKKLTNLEREVQRAEADVAQQAEELERQRAELNAARIDADKAVSEEEERLAQQAQDLEKRREETLADEEELERKPKCGCSLM